MAKQQARPRDFVELDVSNLDSGYYVQVSKDGVNPDKKLRVTAINAPVGSNTGDILIWNGTAYVPTPHYKAFTFIISDSDTAVTVADGKEGWTCPEAFNNWKIDDVIISAHTKGVTGTTTGQLRKRRNESDSDILSTPVTMTTTNYSNNGVVNATYETLNTGDMLYPDIDTIHSGTAPLGVSVTVTIKPL